MTLYSVGDVQQMSGPRVDWIWEGYFARDTVTLLVSEPKLGKTTFMFRLLKAMQTGQQLFGRSVARTGALYFTEEPPAAITQKCDAFGLTTSDPIRIAFKRHITGDSLPHLCQISDPASAGNWYGLIIVDTLAAWSDLHGDAENSAGECERVMSVYRHIAHRNQAAVVLIHHCSKGDSGESVRGSTALTGAADSILLLTRDKESENLRLRVTSRFIETPAVYDFKGRSDAPFRQK